MFERVSEMSSVLRVPARALRPRGTSAPPADKEAQEDPENDESEGSKAQNPKVEGDRICVVRDRRRHAGRSSHKKATQDHLPGVHDGVVP